MEVVPLTTGSEVAELAADILEAAVRANPRAVLGLATGSTPLPTYAALIERHDRGDGPSYEAVQCFTLDEYLGLPPDHPQTYRATIARELTDRLHIPSSQVHAPDPDPDGLTTAGERYEKAIVAAGGIDVQVLGIGADGHLAFNEPGSSLASLTRVKTLTEQTRHDNARFFGSSEQVPRHALTQGLGTILRARRLLLLATGSEKSSALAAAVEGPLSAACPASVLQLHPDVTVLTDAHAGSSLARREHYREVYAAKAELPNGADN
ncbi:glucosamine-6-phosphate deaminase [Nocardioides sp. Soil797]|nr:glucosamine-6-phosphate deaminase [Nocardioides sp. Soil797]